MTDGIPGDLVPYTQIAGGYGGGRALPLIAARVRVANHREVRPIGPADKCVAFTVDLEAGEARLQTFLYDASGNDIGAYYVYVERLSND